GVCRSGEGNAPHTAARRHRSCAPLNGVAATAFGAGCQQDVALRTRCPHNGKHRDPAREQTFSHCVITTNSKELWHGNELRRDAVTRSPAVNPCGWTKETCIYPVLSPALSEAGETVKMHAPLPSSVNVNSLSWETVVPCAC